MQEAFSELVDGALGRDYECLSGIVRANEAATATFLPLTFDLALLLRRRCVVVEVDILSAFSND